jgi:glycosyltransferase involved in cell wall biosynthesis
MSKQKLIRVTTVPISLKVLLEGQHRFMNEHFEVIGISNPEPELDQVKNEEGIRVIPIAFTRKISPLKDLKSVWQLYCVFKKEKPLIVHTHTPKAGITGMLASYLAKVPLRLHTVAGLPLMEATGTKRKILNFVEKLTYRFATNIYPNSKGLYDFIISEKFTKQEKLKIIGSGSSNGINTAYFNPDLFDTEKNNALKKNLQIPLNNFVFVFVGRLVKDKGINELIEAFSKLSLEKKNTTLLLVGNFENDLDPLLPKTLHLINSLNNIIYVGYQNDVRPYLAISNTLVFPSYREGFPNVVMQAGAMGLPAIVTNINGCNEIITEKKNGIIIILKSSTAIYEAMNTLLSNNDLFHRYSNNARYEITSKYERRYIWESLLQEYQTLKAKL